MLSSATFAFPYVFNRTQTFFQSAKAAVFVLMTSVTKHERNKKRNKSNNNITNLRISPLSTCDLVLKSQSIFVWGIFIHSL